MPRKIHLGDKFGYVTVVEFAGKAKRNALLYRVQCDCGLSSVARATDLKSPKRRYCSAQCKLRPRKGVPVDLVGKRFNNYVVLKFESCKNGYKRWLSLCDCGKTSLVTTSALVRLKSRYCRYCRAQKYFTEIERKEAERGYYKRYRQQNPAKSKASNLRWRRSKGNAAPSWLTKDHWREMNEFYGEARFFTNYTGVAHHVDHIVPLQGKTVCGLHVPWNLQILTRSENSKKINKLKCVPSHDTPSLPPLSALAKTPSLLLSAYLNPTETFIHFQKAQYVAEKH